MKVLHVVPPMCIESLLQEGIEGLMLLAHEVPSNPPIGAEYPETYTMLDCPTYEGVSVSLEDMLVQGERHQVDALVFPDVLGDALRTRMYALEFLSHRDWFESYSIEPIAVCQGVTQEELNGDFRVYKDLGFRTVAIPSYQPRRRLSRLHVLEMVKPFGLYVHLLGLSEDPLALKRYKEFSFVKSVDTSRALLWALKDRAAHTWDWWDAPRPPAWAWQTLVMTGLPDFIQKRWTQNRATLEEWAA